MASERLPSRPACLLVASGASEGEARRAAVWEQWTAVLTPGQRLCLRSWDPGTLHLFPSGRLMLSALGGGGGPRLPCPCVTRRDSVLCPRFLLFRPPGLGLIFMHPQEAILKGVAPKSCTERTHTQKGGLRLLMGFHRPGVFLGLWFLVN